MLHGVNLTDQEIKLLELSNNTADSKSRAERRLKKKEDFFTTMNKFASDSILVLGPDYSIIIKKVEIKDNYTNYLLDTTEYLLLEVNQYSIKHNPSGRTISIIERSTYLSEYSDLKFQFIQSDGKTRYNKSAKAIKVYVEEDWNRVLTKRKREEIARSISTYDFSEFNPVRVEETCIYLGEWRGSSFDRWSNRVTGVILHLENGIQVNCYIGLVGELVIHKVNYPSHYSHYGKGAHDAITILNSIKY